MKSFYLKPKFFSVMKKYSAQQFTKDLIAGVIVAIIMGMTTMLSVVNKGDVGEWNKAVKKCIWIAVVLVIVVMLPTLSRVIGNLFGLDTSCL